MDQQAIQDGMQMRGSLIEEYQLAAIDNCNELLGNFSLR